MIFLLNLIKIETKRILRFLPQIVVGALALCFIIGIISFSASKLLYDKKDRNKVNIAISIPEDERSAKFMISILKDMKSIKENCNFVQVNNEEAAYKMVEKGESYGAIIIPRHFVGDILDGTNTPATVLLPNKSSIEAMLIKDLIDAGTKSLASAQAGIYAITYEYEKSFHESITKDLQDSINIKYMDHTLARESYFNHKEISSTGELTLTEYYICSGIIFFILLLGMGFSKALSPNNNAFYEKLKSYRISKEIVTLTRIISVFIVYMIIAISGFCIYTAVSRYLGKDIMIFRIRDYLLLMFVILSVVSFIVCIFTITDSQISGALLLFIATVVMNFISGGFIPTVFLPKPIQILAPYMLTNALSKQIGTIFLGEFDMSGFLSTCEILIVIYIVTTIIVNIKGIIVVSGSRDTYRSNRIMIKLKNLITKKAGK